MNFDIDAIKNKMLVKYPFFGSVVANVDYKVNKNIQTAATNGRVIYYNPDFLEKLNVDEQTFVFAHEVCHIAFNHILRSKGKDCSLWNTATDGVINAFLKKDGLKILDGCVDIADAINYDAEQLYDKLLEEKQKNSESNKKQQTKSKQDSSRKQNENSGSQGAGSQSQNMDGKSDNSKQQNNDNSFNDESNFDEKQDVGHDTHSMWDDAVRKYEEDNEKKDKKESLLDKIFNRNKYEKKENKGEIEKKQEEVGQLGEKEAFNKNLQEKKKILKEIRDSLSKQAMGYGYASNGEVRNVDNIGRAKPLIDWRYVLREAIKYDVDWSYQNATVEDGVVSARLKEQPMPETEIVLDTSGSIDETLLKNFLRECKNILKHSKLKVGCFDTKFYGFQEIRTEEDIENMKFEGGGGTNFGVAVRAFSRRVENKIIFTDGNAFIPDMPLDAIWIVFGGTKITPKGGKVIQIDDDLLSKLCSLESDSKYKIRLRK